ncbi:uncharacterized protein Z519_03008 [Cladophialophora bantiana CBS 173.52]|uniref:Uncharacterized protein n=1 Tax=Cladophialophora bantiana (strain ATCC 10958 / CBS 173.52 / CDC B-1940 / NIH 8579) TaxID=1442370 RepID=A0A0D2GBL9_CLAB1|nr:uncharacterized protein Z519_03008 [Cladophialophora bantiana CBS 173.52]KIW95942.1 hypothetical protein Z519_03008 [Cladophialophora bantiana CBS 173.52]
MTKGLSAASCISHQGSRFAWIPDALLTDTFNRFCHHKRYGSSVPGPLEAQRRAAKRKNTSLAHASLGGISTDPSIVLGSSANKLAWWQSLKDAEADSVSSRVLPPWLFPFASSVADSKPSSVAIETNRTQLEPRKISEQETMRLCRCETLTEIKDWIQEEGFNLRENAHVGAAIPRHMLQMDFETHEIASYIRDPMFHPPGTSFILQLAHGLLGRTWDAASWGVLHDALCSATELGLLNVNDLKEVITELVNLAEVQLTDANGRRKRVKDNAKMYLIYGMLESLDRSTVLRLTDLGSSFLSGLFSNFATLRYYRGWCRKLLWRLLPWAPKSHVAVIRRITLNQLQHICRHNPHEKVGQMLAKRLAVVDPEILEVTLIDITEKLLSMSMESGTMLYKYLWYHWCGTLAVLGSPAFNVSLTQRAWTSAQSAKSSLAQDQRLLAFAWTTMHLCQDWRTSADALDRLQFLDHFEKLLRSIPEFTEDFLDHAVIALSDMTLPNKHILLRNLARLSVKAGALLPALDARSAAKSILEPGISPSLIDERTQNAHFEGNEALAELIESSNNDLSAFKILSRRMIQKSTASFGFVCHLLETNPLFKLALRTPHVFSQRPGDVDKGTWRVGTGIFADLSTPGGEIETAMSSRSERALNNSSLPSRDEVIDLISHLALSFASSTVATPRAALRRVYWCYLFLRRYGVPVPPAITRALWHVGVTRYGDQGTSATLFKWILLQVSRAEGEAVASLLLWNETFRQMRQEQIAAWTKIDEDEEKRLLADLEAGAANNKEDEEEQAVFMSAASGSSDNDLFNSEEATDPELLKKIIFLKSEPPDKPVWLPRAQRKPNSEGCSTTEEKKQQQEILQRKAAEARKVANLLFRD